MQIWFLFFFGGGRPKDNYACLARGWGQTHSNRSLDPHIGVNHITTNLFVKKIKVKGKIN